MFWEVDLRPHGEQQVFFVQGCSSRGSANPANPFAYEGLEGFEFTLDERTDAKMAMAVLAGSDLSLTQAAKIAMLTS